MFARQLAFSRPDKLMHSLDSRPFFREWAKMEGLRATTFREPLKSKLRQSARFFFLLTVATAVVRTPLVTGGGCIIIVIHFHFALLAVENCAMSSIHHNPSSGMTP